MNEPRPPLPPDVVDELLSAELDDEFEAAAADAGFDAAEARARLDATPGVAERRRLLAAARDVLSVPPLAEAAREHMLAGAMAAAPRRSSVDEVAARRTRRARVAYGVVGAAAAALVIAVGVVAVTSGTDDGDDSVATEVADEAGTDGTEGRVEAEAPSMDAEGDATDEGNARDLALTGPQYYGDVSDAVALRDRVAADLGLELEVAADEDAGAGETSPPLVASGEQAAAQVDDDCVRMQADAYEVAPEPILRALGTYDGQAAEVLVFERAGDSLVLVVQAADCAVRAQQILAP